METVFDTHYSIRPDRISSVVRQRRYTCGPGSNMVDHKGNLEKLLTKKTTVSENKPAIERKFHNFQISVNSQRNLRDKINYLHTFAEPRAIKTYSGKDIHNFKCAFLTFTLPSEQQHPTNYISKNLLDPFLQVLRQRLKMDNYVWRLEFQKNGNVHYHLVTDTYIDYHFALKEWNKILNKHGYIEPYSIKMKSLGWSGYYQKYGATSKKTKDQIFKTWQENEAIGWKSPNSVDVKNVAGKDNIAGYISKYFSKSAGASVCNPLDNEENSFGLRLCFWSRSLSRVKTDSMPMDYYSANFIRLIESVSDVKKIVFDYATVWYYNLSTLPYSVKTFFVEFFNKEKELVNYLPAI